MMQFRYLILLCLLFICSTLAASERADNSFTLLHKVLNSSHVLDTIKKINNKNVNFTINLPHLSPPLGAQNSESELLVKESSIPVGEELILSLYIEQYYIADLFAYKSKQNAQISLTSLFELLDFMITVDVSNKVSAGWFINEKNDFTLNLPEHDGELATVTINGKQTSLNLENYRIEGEDIYVDADIIANWFNLNFSFDFGLLKVQTVSKTPLPIQARLSRKNKKIRQHRSKEPVLPWKASNYQTVSSPLLDMQLYASTNKSNNNTGGYSILGHNDLAYFSSEYYLSGNKNDALTELRFSLSKQANDGDLLGPLQATQYQFGDITPVRTAIGSTGGISRGLRFSNKNLQKTGNTRTKTFSGDIQPGWDIELYRNNILIDRQLSLTDGRYDFKDVPLLFGDNQFKLIFYGPQGQVKTESQQIYVDANELKGKESDYAFSVVDVGERLFNVADYTTSHQPGWLSTVTYNQGITDSLSLHVGLQLLSASEGENRQVYSIGTDFSLFERLLLNVDFQTDQDKHTKGKFNARTQLGNHSFSLNYTSEELFDWRKPEKSNMGQVIQFAMNGRLFNGTFLPLSYQNNWMQKREEDNTVINTLGNQIVYSSSFVALTNQLGYQTSNKNADDFLNGSFRLQKAFGPLYSRLEMGYNIKPDFEMVNYKADLSLPLTDYIESQLDFTYHNLTNKYNTQLSLNWQFDIFNLSTNANYDSDDNWSIGLNTRFSFGYEPTTDQYIFSKRSLSSYGALMARVFEDDNLNGQYDEGERLLEGVQVKALQGSRNAKTNKDGVALLESLKSNKTTDIVIIQDSLDDPFIIPATPGISLTPRTGFLEVLDIPMVNASELDGTVYLRDKQGKEKTGAYLTINLTNSDGEIVATTDTEFDGYYLFTDLVPGKYTLTVDAADIKRKNLHDAKALEFSFSAAGDVIAGADFVIDRYTFVKGYVVDLGRFNSLAMLKTYWQIIKDNYNNALQQQVFYTENRDDQTFNLNAAFFKGKAQAKRACNYLEEKGISCSVKKFEFNL